MKAARVIAAGLALAAWLAFPAAAKEGVRAELDAPVDVYTPAGRTITVRWHLEDAGGRGFGGGGIYLRVSRCGRKPVRVPATAVGRGYTARFKVPKPGIHRLTVGLPGWRVYPGGKRERADAYFAFKPALVSKRACP